MPDVQPIHYSFATWNSVQWLPHNSLNHEVVDEAQRINELPYDFYRDTNVCLLSARGLDKSIDFNLP